MGTGDIPGATWRDSGPTGHFCSNITTIRLILVDQWLKVMTGSNQMTRDGSLKPKKKKNSFYWCGWRGSHVEGVTKGIVFLFGKQTGKASQSAPEARFVPLALCVTFKQQVSALMSVIAPTSHSGR